MSCDICGRGACANWFHSADEQERYEKVIEAFEKARDLRTKVQREILEDETEKTIQSIKEIDL